MRAGTFKAKPKQPGANKQFGGGGGKTPFTATPKQATASMQGKDPPGGTGLKSIARKDARKNTIKAGGKKVF